MLVNNPELLPRLDPWTVVKRVARFILNLHLPESGYSPTHHIPFEEPEDGLWTHEGHMTPEDMFKHRNVQPELWEGLPYYHGPTNHTAPNGQQAVFTKKEFNERLDGSA